MERTPPVTNTLLDEQATDHAPDLNPLLSLTPALLHHVTGDRRKQVMTYLKHWEQHATLLRYLDVWLAMTPDLATLRQARAETLIALGQPQAALAELDAIDEQRKATRERIQLRMNALIALQDWDGASALQDGSINARGDLLMAQGRYEEAKGVYAELAALREGPPTAREIRAALDCGELRRAAGLWTERQAARTGVAPSIAELRLQLLVAQALKDERSIADAEATLVAMEEAERATLIEVLGLGEHIDLEVVPDVPAMEEVEDVEVPSEVLEQLQHHWGYAHLRGGQSATIARVMRGESVLAVLPTGAGKSLTYQLPAMLLDGATVVVSPLIALMKDQIDGLPPAVRDRAVAINSTLSSAEVARRLREVREGQYKLVYVAPERMRQQPFVQALHNAGIARFVVDEAHCVSLWGLSFRPDYLFLRRVLEELGPPPVLALTATATPDTRDEIIEQLGTMEPVTTSVFRSNLHFSVVQVPNVEAKSNALLDLCHAIDGPILVYARARDRCEELAHFLRRKGIKAGHYHARAEDREQAQEAFMSGEVRVLVATVAFGMGIDKPDIRTIIHYNLPQSIEAYYQEAGRAGRDGEPSQCVLLYTSSDKGQLTRWLREEALDRDHLRAVYRSLRTRARNGYALIAPEVLMRDVIELDETQLRVALGMLERVGLIVRHFDLPRSLRVTMVDDGDDPEWQRFVEVAGLQPEWLQEIDPIDLAVALDCRPDQIEANLLRWSAQNLVRVDTTMRDWLIELLPAPADTPERIEGMLQEYATRQDARIEAMVGYAKGLSCRHRALAAHFGERLPACGNACDVCAGDLQRAPKAARKAGPTRNGISTANSEAAITTALSLLRNLPYSVGRKSLVNILIGSVESPNRSDQFAEWGMLASWTKTAIGRLIDELVERDLVVHNKSGAYPILEMTVTGQKLLDDTEGFTGGLYE